MSQENAESLVTSFRVSIPNCEAISFASCQGLEFEVDVVSIPDGGRGSGTLTSRGLPRVNRITFSRGALKGKNSGKGLMTWLTDVQNLDKPLKKQVVTIELLDSASEKLRAWEVRGAWPFRWAGPLLNQEASELTLDYISFAHEGIQEK